MEIEVHGQECECILCKEAEALGKKPERVWTQEEIDHDMGVDTHGARVSVDGLEAWIAISPEGIQPSPINRMQFNISKHDS